MNILKSLESALTRMKQKRWDRIYILIDLHGTIIKPNQDPTIYEPYPYALETLQILTKLDYTKIILWTCTRKEDVERVVEFFRGYNIEFDYYNENPEIQELELTDPTSLSFDNKLYYNLGLDDKFGFDPDVDWKIIYDYLKNINNYDKRV